MTLTRRSFVKTSAVAGGGLLVGIHLPLSLDGIAAEATDASFAPNAFLRIDPDGTITITVPRPEMGQGVRTALPMLVAEELEADWKRIRIEQADLDERYGPQYVGGSNSVRGSWQPLREAGAAARELLVRAAAARWNVPAESCVAREGHVHHPPSGRSLGYGELAGDAAALPLPDELRLKDRSEFRIVGRPARNLDTPAIVDGSIRFGLDVKVPGMLYAAIERSPVFGGRVASLDASRARQVSGVREVIAVDADAIGELPPNNPRLSHGVAVLADSTWAALQGRAALDVTWEEGDGRAESSEQFWRLCEEAVARPAERVIREDGDVEGALRRSAQRLRAVYTVPYLAHAQMEPLNCTARVEAARCEIWAPNQNPANVLEVAQRITGLPADAIAVHLERMGGAFGRRFYGDDVAEAVHLAKAAGAPVQVVWTREDDIRHGAYRPAGYHVVEAGLDASGRPIAWTHHLANASRYTALGRMGGPAGAGELYADDLPAQLIPNLRLSYTSIESLVPRGQWRAIAESANVFVVQSFLDELAHAAGRDPLRYQLELLGPPRELPYFSRTYSTGRLRAVLERAAERAGWGGPRPAGRGRGIAASYANSAYVAHVAEVSVDDAGTVRVQRVVSAVDIGQVVNPAGVEAQVEGSIVFGLSAALYGEITIRDGAVEQSNFHDYPVLRIDAMPEVEVHIIDSDAAPMGMGEGALPPLAPAVANAIYAATGVRARRLPVRDRARP